NLCYYNDHLGAVLADIIIQAGVNYKSVVLPRVLNIYNNYPKANDLSGLIETINNTDISIFLNWNNQVKISRYESMIEFLLKFNINTSFELRDFLLKGKFNQDFFLSIPGVGYKTLDYFLKLMNVETIAVDRHI